MIEILGYLGIAVATGAVYVMGSIKEGEQKQSLADMKSKLETEVAKIEQKKPELGDHTRLIIELLQADEIAWVEKRTKYDTYTFTHPTGVRITYRGTSSVGAEIFNVSQTYESAVLSSADCKALASAIQSYRDRKRNREQRELARILAERIQERGKGIVHDIPTGAAGLDPAAEKDNLAGHDFVPAGMLVYDKHAGKVVKIGGADSERLLMDASLAKRYAFVDPDRLVHKSITNGTIRTDCLTYDEYKSRRA
jgi:hypothetical protein